MARPEVEMEQANWQISAEAARLLAQLAPAEEQRGQFVSQLILEAAQHAGLVAPTSHASPAKPATAQEVAELREEVADLKTQLIATGLLPESRLTLDSDARAEMIAFLDERIRQADALSPEADEQAAAELAAFKQRLNENRAPEPPLFP
jgi:hypothetical protein